MARKDNEFTSAVFALVEEFRALREMANNTDIIPFGMEVVKKKDAAKRLEQMSPEQRRQLLNQPAMREQILNSLRSDDASIRG